MSTLKLEHISNINSSGNDLSIDTNGNIGIAMTPDSAVKLSVTGAIGPTNGTDAAPTHTFYSDPDTGMYRSGANALSFSTGGSNALTLNSSQNANFAGNVGIGISPASPLHINMGTDKNIQFSGGIGEIGSVPGFQATNDASSGLRSMGMRASTLRFATGSSERLRIEDNAVGIGTDSPSTTDSGYNEGALHVHNATGSGAQVRWTNSTTGTGTSDGFMISKWSDKNTYITNFDDGAKTVFTQSNGSGTLVADTMVLDGNGNIGIGISPATTAGVNYARMVIDADSSTYPKSLEINATDAAGPNFAISSYSDSNGSYYLLGANLSYQTNGNFAWETNGEHMAGISIDSRAGHGITFVDSFYDSNTTAYVPAEIGKIHTSSDSRVDMIADASGITASNDANAFFVAKAKGYYFAGLDIESSNGHTGAVAGLYPNGNAAGRAVQIHVGGTGLNAGDVVAVRANVSGNVTTPNQPSCSVYNMGFGSSATSWSSAGTGSVNGGLVGVIHHNNGNHYDTSTGYFTAPVAGYYLCNLNVYGKKDNNQGDNSGYWWGYFQKNGGYYYGNYIMEAYYNSGDYDQGASISAIIYLAANDTLRPYCGAYAHGVQVYGPNTGFSCHLLG